MLEGAPAPARQKRRKLCLHLLLRSIVNRSATTKQEMPTYVRAIHDMKNGQIDIESWKTLMKKVHTTKYKMSNLIMRGNKNVEN